MQSVVRAALDRQSTLPLTQMAPTTTGTSVVAFEMIRALASAPQRTGKLSSIIVRNGATSAFNSRVGDVVDNIYTLDEVEQMDAPIFDLGVSPGAGAEP